MAWTDNYIGIPFKRDGHDRNGIDCWRLVVLVYREMLGIQLPSYQGIFSNTSPSSLLGAVKQMRIEREKWIPVSCPDPFDVVTLRINGLFHVGIAINRAEMLHIDEQTDSVIERFSGLLWKNRVEGFLRYAGR